MSDKPVPENTPRPEPSGPTLLPPACSSLTKDSAFPPGLNSANSWQALMNVISPQAGIIDENLK